MSAGFESNDSFSRPCHYFQLFYIKRQFSHMSFSSNEEYGAIIFSLEINDCRSDE